MYILDMVAIFVRQGGAMKVLILFFFSCSLVFCQADEDTLNGKFYWKATALHLLPENYLEPKVNFWPKAEVKYEQPILGSEFKAFGFSNKRSNSLEYDPLANTLLSQEAARTQLSVIRNRSRPLTYGSPQEILGHIILDAVSNNKDYSLAVAYYQQVGYSTGGARDPIAMTNYNRDHDVLRAIWSPLLSSLKRSATTQARYELGKRLLNRGGLLEKVGQKLIRTH